MSMISNEDQFPVYWPGNFFYKSASDVIWPTRHGWSLPVPNTNSVPGDRSRYILGCYGPERNEGFDVIRLAWSNPDGAVVSWRCSEPFGGNCWQCGYNDFTSGFGQPGGLPEVFGGGDAWTGPWWYYNEGGRNNGNFIYGAPDGIDDGVILVLTDDGVFLD